MSSISKTVTDPRAMLPRWLKSRRALHGAESHSLSSRELDEVLGKAELDERRREFQNQPSLFTAADLVSTAVSLGRAAEVEDVLSWVSGEENLDALPGLERLAHSLGDSGTRPLPLLEGDINAEIRRIRMSLRRYPRNALGWLDLAYLYAGQGEDLKAERSVRIALDLQPHNRLVVRPASRFWVHAKDPETALALLDESGLVDDPWVAAAQLSVEQLLNRKPRSVRSFRKLLERVPPRHATELAAALGTLELSAGARRNSRKHFDVSILEPTENALAQVEWAHLSSGIVEVPDVLRQRVEDAYEAKARHFEAAGDPASALEQTRAWLDFQPFSVEPATFGSYVASIGLGDFVQAEEIAQRGLTPNPDDSMLLNNLAFALASQDRVEEAKQTFARIPRSDVVSSPTMSATAGLIAYRSGDSRAGRELYGVALRSARSLPPHIQALMALFWLREERNAGGEETRTAMEAFSALRRQTNHPSVKRWSEAIATRSDP